MSTLQLNNAFQEFELFLEMQTKEQIMSDTTKSLIINTLLENSKGKKGLFGIGKTSAIDIANEESLQSLLNELTIEPIGNDVFNDTASLRLAFKKHKEQKIQYFNDGEALSWIDKMQKKINERDTQQEYVPSGYDSINLIEKFTKKLRDIGFEWLKVFLTAWLVMTMHRFSDNGDQEEENIKDLEGKNVDEIQDVLFMQDWFWGLYERIGKNDTQNHQSKKGVEMIANLETYTQNFYIEFVRAVDEEIINCKRRIDILNTVLQDKTVFVGSEEELSDSVKQSYQDIIQLYESKQNQFKNEKENIQLIQKSYEALKNWLQDFGNTKQFHETCFSDFNQISAITDELLLDTDVSWDVVKKIDSQIMKIRDIQKIVVDVKPFTEKDHLSIKDIGNIDRLHAFLNNKSQGWNTMVERTVIALKEKKEMCLEPLQKDANNVAERFIEASAGFIQEFMDVHSPTGIYQIPDAVEARKTIQKMIETYESFKKDYASVIAYQSQLSNDIIQNANKQFALLTVFFEKYNRPLQLRQEAMIKKIDHFSDHSLLFEAQKQANITTAEHILWLCILFHEGTVLFEQGPLKVIRYNNKNYLQVYGYLAEVSDQDIVSKRLEKIDVCDEFGNTEKIEHLIKGNNNLIIANFQKLSLLQSNKLHNDAYLFVYTSVLFGKGIDRNTILDALDQKWPDTGLIPEQRALVMYNTGSTNKEIASYLERAGYENEKIITLLLGLGMTLRTIFGIDEGSLFGDLSRNNMGDLLYKLGRHASEVAELLLYDYDDDYYEIASFLAGCGFNKTEIAHALTTVGSTLEQKIDVMMHVFDIGKNTAKKYAKPKIIQSTNV